MPANIDQTTGTAAVMTVGPAWHRLGKELNAPATAAEAIKYACLDWRVSKMPLFAGEREHRSLAKAKGRRLGRPRVIVDASRIAFLRAQGDSWSQIQSELGVSKGTAQRAFAGLPKIV
jgi:hypothetical protein